MAKVHDNVITEGLSGKLGKRLVFRKGRGGRTIVVLSPVYSEGRTYNPSQLEHQEAFKKAVDFAKVTKDEPIYADRARGTEMTPYNVAVQYWFGQPEVLEIDTSEWTGRTTNTKTNFASRSLSYSYIALPELLFREGVFLPARNT